MIRKFEAVDARRIRANSFSDVKDVTVAFKSDNFCKHTLVGEKGEVYAIIVFGEYSKKNYLAFFLIAEDMPTIHARELKSFIYNAIFDLGANRVNTDSLDCPVLNRWHKFLGFTLEGKREKMIDDKDYNLWGLLRGRDF